MEYCVDKLTNKGLKRCLEMVERKATNLGLLIKKESLTNKINIKRYKGQGSHMELLFSLHYYSNCIVILRVFRLLSKSRQKEGVKWTITTEKALFGLYERRVTNINVLLRKIVNIEADNQCSNNRLLTHLE